MSDVTKLGRLDLPLKFSFLYADDDFINAFDHGASLKLIEQKNRLLNEREGEQPDRSIKDRYNFYMIPNSTHKIYNDQPDYFVDLILKELL